MKGVRIIIALGLLGAIGCTSTPKREMRQPVKEELTSPPEGQYLNPPDYTSDQPTLVPKANTPGLNTNGMPGAGGPGAPGGPSSGASGMRK